MSDLRAAMSQRDFARESIGRIAYHLHLALGVPWEPENVERIIEHIEVGVAAQNRASPGDIVRWLRAPDHPQRWMTAAADAIESQFCESTEAGS